MNLNTILFLAAEEGIKNNINFAANAAGTGLSNWGSTTRAKSRPQNELPIVLQPMTKARSN